jgi:hypothetical protein
MGGAQKESEGAAALFSKWGFAGGAPRPAGLGRATIGDKANAIVWAAPNHDIS